MFGLSLQLGQIGHSTEMSPNFTTQLSQVRHSPVLHGLYRKRVSCVSLRRGDVSIALPCDRAPAWSDFIAHVYSQCWLSSWFCMPCHMQNNGPSVGFALAGGIFLCIGNIATQYSLAFVGLSVMEVVASSITVVGGKSASWLAKGAVLWSAKFVVFRCCGSSCLLSLRRRAQHSIERVDQRKTHGETAG